MRHDARGRWPANLALSHIPPDADGNGGCRRVGTKRVKGGVAHGQNASAGSVYGNGKGLVSQPKGDETRGYTDTDGLEEVEAWECVRDPATGEYLCPIALLDEQSGERRSAGPYPSASHGTGNGVTYCHQKPQGPLYSDTGGASRFFFCAKASKRDRGEGNTHPTVKSVSKSDGSPGLMRWLCRLITPPGGLILDPFAGSGSTGVAAVREGFRFLGIEADPAYHAIAERRLAEARQAAPLYAEAP